MTADGYAFFDTAIGRCGIAWNAHGIVGVQLPEPDERGLGERMRRRFPNARELQPAAEAQRALDGIVTLLRGEASDLTNIRLDMDRLPLFHRQVYEVARSITPGATLTYGDIAMRLGAPGAARAVGRTLGRNPFAIIVPCHRVLAAHGKIGGFSAGGGIRTKLRLLAIEGAPGMRGLFDDDDGATIGSAPR